MTEPTKPPYSDEVVQSEISRGQLNTANARSMFRQAKALERIAAVLEDWRDSRPVVAAPVEAAAPEPEPEPQLDLGSPAPGGRERRRRGHSETEA